MKRLAGIVRLLVMEWIGCGGKGPETGKAYEPIQSHGNVEPKRLKDSALAPAAKGMVKWPDALGIRYDRKA
jgi:hypothetical protein